MLMAILKGMKAEFLKRFKQGFNLSRHGTTKSPDKMNEHHKQLAQSIFDSSCMTLTETGVMYPTFFLIKGEEFMPVAIDPESMENVGMKGYSSMVMNIADQERAEAVILVSEQWSIKRSISDEEAQDFIEGKLLPSLDPDRQEVLTLVYITRGGRVRVLSGEIQRQIDNTPFIRESKWSTPDAMSSNIIGAWGTKDN